MLEAAFVLQIHDEILQEEPGLPGFSGSGFGGLESALMRVDQHIRYDGLADVFGIAAMYAVAIARGHIFNDANKRTALVTALTYLKLQGIDVERDATLEGTMVEVAKGTVDAGAFANRLADIARLDDIHSIE